MPRGNNSSGRDAEELIRNVRASLRFSTAGCRRGVLNLLDFGLANPLRIACIDADPTEEQLSKRSPDERSEIRG